LTIDYYIAIDYCEIQDGENASLPGSWASIHWAGGCGKRKMGKEEQLRRLEMALGWSCFAEIEQEAVASVNRSET
jgi:hypothetical protein